MEWVYGVVWRGDIYLARCSINGDAPTTQEEVSLTGAVTSLVLAAAELSVFWVAILT